MVLVSWCFPELPCSHVEAPRITGRIDPLCWMGSQAALVYLRTFFSFTSSFFVARCWESHSFASRCFPPRTEADVQPQLTRRRPGQSSLTTARNEADTVTILSGTERSAARGGAGADPQIGSWTPRGSPNWWRAPTR